MAQPSAVNVFPPVLPVVVTDDTSDTAIPAHFTDTASASTPDNFENVPRPYKDRRPTMTDVMAHQEHLRSDRVAVDDARLCVDAPKPLACDIEVIKRQYEADGACSSRRAWNRHDPYAMSRAKYDMVIEIGQAFAKTPLLKILFRSLARPQ